MRELVAQAGPRARSGSIAEMVAASDVIVLATPWEATEAAVRGAGDLTGKILIDATVPLLPALAGLAVGTTDSGAEMIARWSPGAKVVKAFNSVGDNVAADPVFPEGNAAMFYCGDDAAAKQTVAGLIGELGLDPVDAGPLKSARLLEPFGMLWINMAFPQGHGREIGFRFLKR